MIHKAAISLNTTKKVEIIDITDKVRAIVARSGVRDGICTVISSHTTMAIRVNEHEKNLVVDTEEFFSNGALVPDDKMYRHDCMENRPECLATEPKNGPSHLKAMLLGAHEDVIVENGNLRLGKWQAIEVVELDGPRNNREVMVMVQGIDAKTEFEQYFEDRASRINEAIDAFLDKTWEAYILRAQRYLMRGGKRIRGTVLLLNYEAFGGKDISEAMDAAVAVEVLQSMSLALDDPADGDRVRRGKPAAWVAMKIRELVTLADATIPHAIYTLRKYGARVVDEALSTWKDMGMGQVHDLFLSNWRGSTKLYPETINKKTGKMFALSCVLGARIAGVPYEQVQIARKYGQSLGFLFQVADDIADLKAGKSVSDSFRQWAGLNPDGRLEEAINSVELLALKYPESPYKIHLKSLPQYAVDKLMAEVKYAKSRHAGDTTDKSSKSSEGSGHTVCDEADATRKG